MQALTDLPNVTSRGQANKGIKTQQNEIGQENADFRKVMSKESPLSESHADILSESPADVMIFVADIPLQKRELESGEGAISVLHDNELPIEVANPDTKQLEGLQNKEDNSNNSPFIINIQTSKPGHVLAVPSLPGSDLPSTYSSVKSDAPVSTIERAALNPKTTDVLATPPIIALSGKSQFDERSLVNLSSEVISPTKNSNLAPIDSGTLNNLSETANTFKTAQPEGIILEAALDLSAEVPQSLNHTITGLPPVDSDILLASTSETPTTAPIGVSVHNNVATNATLSTPAILQAPTNALIAKPTDIPAILAEKTPSADPENNRVIVQLDPPELGRVTIDFRFEGQVLQAITVTGETPEALRQLRLMHFELIQALEQNGLTNSDLSFQKNDSPQKRPDKQFNGSLFPENETAPQQNKDWPPQVNSQRNRSNSLKSGLDIKV